MMPSHMALYAFLALQKKKCQKDQDNCIGCQDCFMEISFIINNPENISKIYRKISGTRPFAEMSNSGIKGLNAGNYRSLRSKINQQLIKTFGNCAAQEIEISAIGTRPDTRYDKLMDKTKIRIMI